jgi:excisionase family DNA binding protein
MTNEPEKWSSLEEVAEHIGVHKDTIRNWVRKGIIPAHKIGKLWKFRLSEVDEWITSGESENLKK